MIKTPGTIKAISAAFGPVVCSNKPAKVAQKPQSGITFGHCDKFGCRQKYPSVGGKKSAEIIGGSSRIMLPPTVQASFACFHCWRQHRQIFLEIIFLIRLF